jgi:hypothetical protein
MASNSINQKIICSGGLFLAVNTKRFLFLQRTQFKTAGLWGFVGGKKEPTDHTPFNTLERENYPFRTFRKQRSKISI